MNDKCIHGYEHDCPYCAEEEAVSRKSQTTGSIPEDVRLWIAEVRDRLEHVWRDPITQDEATTLITKSATLALSHNCYQE